MLSRLLLLICTLFSASNAAQWPYDRYHSHQKSSGKFMPDKARPASGGDSQNDFIQWLHRVTKTQDSGAVRKIFLNNTIPTKVNDFDDLLKYVEEPAKALPPKNGTKPLQPSNPELPSEEAEDVLGNLGFPLDRRCTVDRSRWWYRTYDGSCNWLKEGEIEIGQMGTAKARDFKQYSFKDGISKPRDGPNARAISNAFFKRKKSIYYEHTPLLLGLIEFIMHDVTYSLDAPNDWIDIPMPPDEEHFSRNTTLRVGRTQAVPGTGTSKENPRENVNMASTWLDLSSLYGSTPEVARSLRSFTGGRMLTQEIKDRGHLTYASYLPFNTMKVPINTRPGVDPETLFAGGDPRTNEDWLMLGVHTLLLREHNRLCGILSKQHPEYDDERLFQTIRLVMSSKYAMIANAYQMAYWTDEMPWPRDDGLPLWRQMYGKNSLEINPMNTYPWPLVTKKGKPMVVSAEMAIVYRFHEFIIPEFPIIDEKARTIRNQSVFETAFNSKGFIDTGLDSILRGTIGTHIPNFKSGVDENFRSAGKYRGRPFDIVAWSIVHEREQGIPTFNVYFRAYNAEDPAVVVPIRNKFEDYSSDKAVVKKLKKLYKTPDDVDLVVGVQLDEEYFPGTTVPKTALIISLFSLFGMGNSDRFSIGFAVTRCLLVDKPWDCKPSNALEELLWAPKPDDLHPNRRWFDSFWLNELDFPAHGANLLWRLVTENTDIKCLQQRPLFPADPKTNPVLCALPKLSRIAGIISALTSAIQLGASYYRQNKLLINTLLIIVLSTVAYFVYQKLEKKKRMNTPHVYGRWIPIIGKAIDFNKDPKKVLLRGLTDFGQTLSRCFGIKLATMTHFVISQPADMDFMMADYPYEAKFNLNGLMSAINMPLITGKDNFESNLHNVLIASHLSKPDIVTRLNQTVSKSSERFVKENITPGHHDTIVPLLMDYITAVVGGTFVGEEVFGLPDLSKIFSQFNDHAMKAMGFAGLLPSFLRPLAGLQIKFDYWKARRILLPIIEKRRNTLATETVHDLTFLDLILESVKDNRRVADTLIVIVWAGLANLQATLTSLVLDLIENPQTAYVVNNLLRPLPHLDPADIIAFPTSPNPPPSNPWTPLRAAMFESVRLCGQMTGPARLCQENIILPSSTASLGQGRPQTLPAHSIATLSAYYSNRSPAAYGATAKIWDPARFLQQDPDIGGHAYISWGLRGGKHHCPGRWFGQACLLIMTKAILGRVEITPTVQAKGNEPDDQEARYVYDAAGVKRKDLSVDIGLRVDA